MANYSDDLDLIKIRSNIMQLGVDDWEDMHTEAKRQIDRLIEVRWYKAEAVEQGYDVDDYPFDDTLVDTDQLKLLSCYKTLELIYEFLMKDTPEPDGFTRQMEHFKDRFNEELQTILSLGVHYDWDDDGTVDSDEKFKSIRRTLKRI